MSPDPLRMLRSLEGLRDRYGSVEVTQRKLELLRRLERRRLASSAAVLRLHEVLCFLRAYPDSRPLLQQVERMLRGFAARRDLQRFKDELVDSGIAGTTITYPLYWPMARWLAGTYPQQLHLDWEGFEKENELLAWLPLLVPPCEAGALDELTLSARAWVDRLRGPHVTDATFLVRRLEALPGSDAVREAVHDSLELQYVLEPGEGTASRTHAWHRLPLSLQKRDLQRQRPDLNVAIRQEPRRVRFCSPKEGERLVALARQAMLTRSRDLDVFSYGNPRDVRLVDFGDGLQFACIGFLPERRLLLHALYGFLTLRNGVPIGYVLASALDGIAGIAYNTFETWRGAEAAFVFGRVLAMAHHLFGARSFSIDPYQLGYGNDEGLASGAWWFYYKLGFRPLDTEVKRVLRGELRRMKRNPKHRSALATLEKLASQDVYYHLDASRRDRPLPAFEALSLAITRWLTRVAGADREAGVEASAATAQRLLGVRSLRGWSRDERRAWMQWAPLVCALRGVRSWPPGEKRQLVAIIRAKGGRHESDFVPLFDAHPRLRGAILRLAKREWEAL